MAILPCEQELAISRANLKFLGFFLAWLWVSTLATAAWSEDRLSVIRSIVVEAGERSGEVNCFGCSVRVRGVAQSDIVAIGGDIEVDGGWAARQPLPRWWTILWATWPPTRGSTGSLAIPTFHT